MLGFRPASRLVEFLLSSRGRRQPDEGFAVRPEGECRRIGLENQPEGRHNRSPARERWEPGINLNSESLQGRHNCS